MRLENLEVSFNTRLALSIDSFEFEPNGCYCIIGHNGSGKTTLARCITNTLEGYRGNVELDPSEQRIRYMPQRSYAFYGSAMRNVLLGAGKHDDESAGRARYLMERLALSGLAQARAKTLSGGETARMAFARTLMDEADWLILDEPTAAFDIESTLTAEKLIEEYRDEYGAGVILITHSLNQARRVTDQLVFMEAGHIVEFGDTGPVLDHPATAALSRFIEM